VSAPYPIGELKVSLVVTRNGLLPVFSFTILAVFSNSRVYL